MTEAEWHEAKRPSKLLRYIHAAADPSDRKLRLFGVACCRRVAEQMPEATLAALIDGCERLADHFSLPGLDGLRRAADRCVERAQAARAGGDLEHFEYAIAVSQLTEYPLAPEHCADSCMSALCGHDDYVAGHGEMLFQVDLLRDIFGNPFRPVAFDPAWRTDTAIALAAHIYDGRDFAALDVLVDALQDAGCEDAGVLSHCRDTSLTHVPGCWAVDLVLGKE